MSEDLAARIRSGERPLRAAVVQAHGAHDEVMPSMFDLLLANGVEPTGFLHSHLQARGDIFGPFTSYGDRVQYRDFAKSETWDELTEELADFDLLVLNTFAYAGPSVLALRTGLPTIGIVHNPGVVMQNPASMRLIRSGQATPATLAPHVTAWMLNEKAHLFSKAVTLGAWMWDMPQEQRVRSTGRRRITIPGAVNFSNRDYLTVLETLPGLVDRFGTDRFEIAVVGGGPDRVSLETIVADRGLSDIFVFADLDQASGSVLSADFYPLLAGSDLLLPLLPERRPDYRAQKITAGVSSSVGFGVPAVIDRWTAGVYDLPSVAYPLGLLADGIADAIEMSEDEIAGLRQALGAHREVMISRASYELAHALQHIGAPRPQLKGDLHDDETQVIGVGEQAEPDEAGAIADTEAPAVQVDRDDKEAFLAFAELVLPSSHAQRLQDLWALWETGFATDGYFVEFGALNGRDFSNSYLMEKIGWNGIVSEPNPDYEQRLRSNRDCTISTDCVFDKTGDTVEFHAVKGRPALSTVGGFGEDDSRSALREEYVTHQISTISLHDLLVESGAPATIDYLSIDTEGSELVILRAFDFAAQPIRLITVEHNDAHRDELYELLTSQGYRRKWPELSGHDDWYVLDGTYEDWSTERLPAFVEAARGVSSFDRDLADRARIVGQERHTADSPFSVLGLPAHLVETPTDGVVSLSGVDEQTLSANYRFQSRFLDLLARRTGLSDQDLGARVQDMFIGLCRKLDPTVTLEIGAFEASYSRAMKAALPAARVIAYEANPHVYEHFKDDVLAAGVRYEHKAASDVSGTVEFQVPKDFRGSQRPQVNQMSSIKANRSTQEYERVGVQAVRIDDEFPQPQMDRFVAWIDVEGATEEVLSGAAEVLEHVLAIYIEVESHAIWDGQWLDSDVVTYLTSRGFVLIGRDKLKPGQFNLVFVHRSVARKPMVARHAVRVFPKAQRNRGAAQQTASTTDRASNSDRARRLARRAAGKAGRKARELRAKRKV